MKRLCAPPSGGRGGSAERVGARVFLCAFGVAVLLSGCAASGLLLPPSSSIQPRLETEMIAPEFSRERFQSGGVALLAVLTTGEPEGMRQNAAYEIFQGLRASFRDLRVIPRADAIEKISSAEKEEEYKTFVKNYEERRPIDLDRLRQWGQIEGVRYLLIGSVDYADKRTDAQMAQIGEQSVAGKISVFSSGPNMFPVEVQKRVSLRGEIWDSLCGRAVWIGRSVVTVREPSGSEQVRVEDIFIAAGRGLSTSLVNAMGENKGSQTDCREKEKD